MEIIEGITPSVSMNVRVSHGGSYDSGVSVSGKNYYYFKTNKDTVKRGRLLNTIDEENSSYVCLIDSDMVETFFYGVDPVGENLYIDGIPFLVVGLFSSEDSTSIADMMGGSPNILIPYTTALKMKNQNVVTSFTVYLADGVDSKSASNLIEAEMDAMFSYEDDCFSITTMSSIEDTMESMLSMMSALLAGIASIALVLGGIGIMNMMLTTVTERTMEIGLKKALGAIPWQIQIQVDEIHAARIRKGDTAELIYSMDSTETPYYGKVERIARIPENGIYTVRIQPDEAESLRLGLTVTVRIPEHASDEP